MHVNPHQVFMADHFLLHGFAHRDEIGKFLADTKTTWNLCRIDISENFNGNACVVFSRPILTGAFKFSQVI